MKPGLFTKVAYAAQQGARVSQFLAQSILSSIALGRRPSAERRKTLPPIGFVLKDLAQLFERDLKNIEAGIYKMPKNTLLAPVAFAKTSTKLFVDLFKVYKRQKDMAVKDFGPEASSDIESGSLPRYFTQNFHFQTDGYMSDQSADLYDHQVELVFAGGAEVMRRQALVPVQKEIAAHRARELTAPLEMIDVACGTGSFLSELASNYEQNLRLTGLDLSPWYLKKARKTLTNDNVLRANFLEANAESIPLKDAQFDLLSCIFLFHELPRLVRTKVAAEMARVLKPGGLMIFVDSIQLGDRPAFDGSLHYFPENYFEPYYADYIKQDLTALFESQGLKVESTDYAFYSKIITARKSI